MPAKAFTFRFESQKYEIQHRSAIFINITNYDLFKQKQKDLWCMVFCGIGVKSALQKETHNPRNVTCCSVQ